LQVVDKVWRPRRDLNPCYRRDTDALFMLSGVALIVFGSVVALRQR